MTSLDVEHTMDAAGECLPVQGSSLPFAVAGGQKLVAPPCAETSRRGWPSTIVHDEHTDGGCKGQHPLSLAVLTSLITGCPRVRKLVKTTAFGAC
jgi:hypothetical protein